MQFVEELPDAALDLVADGPDRGEALARGVVEDPLAVSLAGEERTCIAASHRDDDVGSTDRSRPSRASGTPSRCQSRARPSPRQPAGFTLIPGSLPPDQATARSPASCWKKPIAICERPRVVHAEEQHGGPAVAVQTLDLGEGAQALPREALGHQWQELRNCGPGRELVERGVQEAFDGLGTEDAAELVRQPGSPRCAGPRPGPAAGSPSWGVGWCRS